MARFSIKAVTGVLCSGLFIFLSGSAIAQFGPTPVNVEAVQNRLLVPSNSVSGAIVSQNDAQVSARVAGQLIKVAQVGTQVKTGEVFAQIRDPNLEFRHAEQLARLQSSRHRLDFLNSEVERLTALAQRDLSSKTDLDRNTSDRNQARALVAENQALLQQIELSQSFQKMQAPFDGVIMERLADEGELVAAGTPVVRLVQTTDLEISARVPAKNLSWVQQNKQIAFSSAMGTGNAKVRTAVPVADERTRLIEVRAQVESDAWPVGLDVTVKVPSGKAKQTLAVPRDALVLRRDGARVFRIGADNKAEQVMVTTGVASDNWIEVSGDIKEGDKVVIRGAERIQPGTEVVIKENNEALVAL